MEFTRKTYVEAFNRAIAKSDAAALLTTSPKLQGHRLAMKDSEQAAKFMWLIGKRWEREGVEATSIYNADGVVFEDWVRVDWYAPHDYRQSPYHDVCACGKADTNPVHQV